MRKIQNFGNFLKKINENVNSELLRMIDYTLLKPEATENDIIELCDKADNLGVKSVCVLPKMVSIAAEALKDSDVLVCTVVSFPHGTDSTDAKLSETKQVINSGADEVDMVLNYPKLKELEMATAYYNEDGLYEELVNDVETLVKECHSHTNKNNEPIILKVIVESSMLNEEETAFATYVCIKAGADFIKTSTGMATPDGKKGIAELNKVQIMKKTINDFGSDMKIKASGGLSSMSDLQKFEPYVDRFGVGYTAVDNIFGGQRTINDSY